VATAIHQLDDGAWVSVNDQRVMSVSDLWRLVDHDFCTCEVADVLAEGFVDVGVRPPGVTVRFAGQCIACGAEGVTGWIPIGRVDPDTKEFRPVETDAVHRPRSTSD
jgi:hypothetical protein